MHSPCWWDLVIYIHRIIIWYLKSQGNHLPGKVSQIGLEPWSHIVTTPTGTTYQCNQWQFKALDCTSAVNTKPIPRPSTETKKSAVHPAVTHPHETSSQKYNHQIHACIVHIRQWLPLGNSPTRATFQYTSSNKFPTLLAIFSKPPGQLFPVLCPEAQPVEAEVPVLPPEAPPCWRWTARFPFSDRSYFFKFLLVNDYWI